jgi:solute carrier family 25 oxoglutarate transporter 11
MQADSSLPIEQRRNYKNVFNAFSTITKNEGFFSMWKGATPTVVRAMSLNLGMLATNEQVKDVLTDIIGPGQVTVCSASLVSGCVAAAMSLPFDNVKTKL